MYISLKPLIKFDFSSFLSTQYYFFLKTHIFVEDFKKFIIDYKLKIIDIFYYQNQNFVSL